MSSSTDRSAPVYLQLSLCILRAFTKTSVTGKRSGGKSQPERTQFCARDLCSNSTVSVLSRTMATRSCSPVNTMPKLLRTDIDVVKGSDTSIKQSINEKSCATFSASCALQKHCNSKWLHVRCFFVEEEQILAINSSVTITPVTWAASQALSL